MHGMRETPQTQRWGTGRTRSATREKAQRSVPSGRSQSPTRRKLARCNPPAPRRRRTTRAGPHRDIRCSRYQASRIVPRKRREKVRPSFSRCSARRLGNALQRRTQFDFRHVANDRFLCAEKTHSRILSLPQLPAFVARYGATLHQLVDVNEIARCPAPYERVHLRTDVVGQCLQPDGSPGARNGFFQLDVPYCDLKRKDATIAVTNFVGRGIAPRALAKCESVRVGNGTNGRRYERPCRGIRRGRPPGIDIVCRSEVCIVLEGDSATENQRCRFRMAGKAIENLASERIEGLRRMGI